MHSAPEAGPPLCLQIHLDFRKAVFLCCAPMCAPRSFPPPPGLSTHRISNLECGQLGAWGCVPKQVIILQRRRLPQWGHTTSQTHPTSVTGQRMVKGLGPHSCPGCSTRKHPAQSPVGGWGLSCDWATVRHLPLPTLFLPWCRHISTPGLTSQAPGPQHPSSPQCPSFPGLNSYTSSVSCSANKCHFY